MSKSLPLLNTFTSQFQLPRLKLEFVKLTPASYVTLGRIALVPVFATFALAYGSSVAQGIPNERLRFAALACFITAALSDALDGFLARHYHQRSKLGALLDPAADKFLLFTAVLVLSFVEWGPNWHIPIWLAVLIIGRDAMILGGLAFFKKQQIEVQIKPTWAGKLCTVFQLIAIGWVMLKAVPLSPRIPAYPAALFTLWSGIGYFRIGLAQLHQRGRS